SSSHSASVTSRPNTIVSFTIDVLGTVRCTFQRACRAGLLSGGNFFAVRPNVPFNFIHDAAVCGPHHHHRADWTNRSATSNTNTLFKGSIADVVAFDHWASPRAILESSALPPPR